MKARAKSTYDMSHIVFKSHLKGFMIYPISPYSFTFCPLISPKVTSAGSDDTVFGEVLSVHKTLSANLAAFDPTPDGK